MQAVETAVNTVSGSTGAWGVTISSISTAITDMAGLQTDATNPFTSEVRAAQQHPVQWPFGLEKP